ncbi:MAG: DUF6923 family protein [Thainema sp.]
MGLPFRTSQLASIASQPSSTRQRSSFSLHKTTSRSGRFSWSRFLRSLVLVVIFAIATFGYAPPSRAQATAPFNCDGTLYITNASTDQDPTRLDFLDTSGDFDIDPVLNQTPPSFTYNAAGFRPQDGFIYAIRPNNRGLPAPAAATQPRSTIYRIDSTGAVTPLGVPPGITNADYFAGDVGPNGTLYVYAPVQITAGSAPSGLLTEIDVTTAPPTVIDSFTVQRTDNSNVPELFDVAFNPEDGQLYGFDRQEGDIVRIDVNTPIAPGVLGAVPLAATGNAPGTEIVGGTFFDAFGRIFLYANNGQLYRGQVEPGNNFIQFELLSSPPGVGNNDGASCPYAPLVEKTASSTVVQAGDIVTYTYSFTNSNFVDLQNVTFTDTLLTNGATDGRTFVPGSLQTISGNILNGTTTNNYGVGADANNLVINGITLSPGTTGAFSVDVQIAPGTPAGTFENQAVVETTTATIIPPGGGPPTQINPRIVARTDNPNTPDNFPDPTPIDTTPSATGAIGIAKRAGQPAVNSDGTIDIQYSLIVENLGSVTVNNVQITEDFTQETFISPATFEIIQSPRSVDGLTPNPNFAGTPANPNLLQGNDSLAPGEIGSVFFIVRVTPNGNYGPYNNTAIATGTDPSGNPVTDQSNDGQEPDPNNNGNPGDPNENTPTVVTPQIADLAVEKGVDNPDPNIGDTITYTITLRNLGPSDTTNVTVQEDLPAGFTATAPAGTTYNAATGVWSVPDLDAGQFVVLTLQGTFDGTPFENVAEITGSSVPDPNLANNISRVQVPSVTADLSLEKTLVDTDEIAVGDVITFEIELTNSGPDTATNIQIADDFPDGFEFVEARPATGTYDETTNIWSIASLASGESTSLLLTGRLTADSVTNVAEVSSVDQTDPDSTPNNRDPNEDDYGTITVSISPDLILQKRITALVQDGAVTRFTQPVANPVRPGFVGEVSLPPSAQVTSQDVVEYTIYYLASGTTANNVQICDAIPVGTSYVANTLSTASGTANPTQLSDANDGDGGQFLPELTPAPQPCANSMNPNGSVLVNVGNIPAGQSGFIRFSSQVD